MNNLEQINAKCYAIFKFRYNDRWFNFYAQDLYDRESNRIKNLENELTDLISSHLNNDNLYRKNSQIYYVQLYAVHYLEEKLEDNQFMELIRILLLKEDLPETFLSPLILILMSNKTFPEEIIRRIYENLELQLQNSWGELGKPPYDYRYHLLKREETPEDIMGNLLATYDKLSMEELNDFMQGILYEINYELRNHQIINSHQIETIPQLKMEYHYFELMKEYYHNRMKKQKSV